MDKNIFRIGKVSSVDYENGMIQVVYTDKGGAVTTKLPYANFGNEYNMPRIGEHVVVAHLSNGTSRGIALGGIWNKKNIPRESGKELYRKELSKTPGVAYLRFDDVSGEYLIRAPVILAHGVDRTDLEGPEVNIAANIRTSFESPDHKAALGGVHLMGLEGEDISVQISSGIHVVMDMADLEALIKKVRLETLEEIELAAGKEIHLKNDKFATTLTEIMERLEALESNTPAGK